MLKHSQNLIKNDVISIKRKKKKKKKKIKKKKK